MKGPVAMAGVMAALVVLMLAVRGLQARRVVGPELGRKLVHSGMGLITLSFPWVFKDSVPVWALAVISSGFLLCVRFIPYFAAHYGGILGGIDRASLGEIFFPLGMATAFWLSNGVAYVFCAGASVLALGDTAGALVGKRFGRRKYSIAGSKKSLEGSAAVFGVSFLCVAASLRWLSPGGMAPWVSTAVFAAAAATLAEGCSSYGLDNVLLPVIVVIIVRR